MVGELSLTDRLSSLKRRPDGFGGRCGGRSGRTPARLCFRAGTTGGVLKTVESVTQMFFFIFEKIEIQEIFFFTAPQNVVHEIRSKICQIQDTIFCSFFPTQNQFRQNKVRKTRDVKNVLKNRKINFFRHVRDQVSEAYISPWLPLDGAGLLELCPFHEN
jgi:hypothetical protein